MLGLKQGAKVSADRKEHGQWIEVENVSPGQPRSNHHKPRMKGMEG